MHKHFRYFSSDSKHSSRVESMAQPTFQIKKDSRSKFSLRIKKTFYFITVREITLKKSESIFSYVILILQFKISI